jgi:hypothetical protein
MSCVWKGVISAIVKDYVTCTNQELKNNMMNLTLNSIITVFKHNNKITDNVLWNNEQLSKKQLDENFKHIDSLIEKNVYNGYLCSACDPLFFLICELFQVDIYHTYVGKLMKYEYKNPHIKSRLTYLFESDSGHFWFSGHKYN